MEIPKPIKMELIREIKTLVDENEGSIQVLERAYILAQAVANLLSHDGLPDDLGFSLGEYAYEKLDVAKGDGHKTAWIEKNNEMLTRAIDEYWSRAYANGRDYTLLAATDFSYILGQILPNAPKTALDIGCGTGQVCRELFHRGYKVLGVDIANEAIKIAQQSTVYLGDGIDFKKLDVEAEPFPESNYGLILCKYVYAFIRNKTEFLAKTSKILDEQGTFVVITPAEEYLPPAKQRIAVEHEEVMKSLQVFSKVSFSKRNRDIYYICSS